MADGASGVPQLPKKDRIPVPNPGNAADLAYNTEQLDVPAPPEGFDSKGNKLLIGIRNETPFTINAEKIYAAGGVALQPPANIEPWNVTSFGVGANNPKQAISGANTASVVVQDKPPLYFALGWINAPPVEKQAGAIFSFNPQDGLSAANGQVNTTNVVSSVSYDARDADGNFYSVAITLQSRPRATYPKAATAAHPSQPCDCPPPPVATKPYCEFVVGLQYTRVGSE